MRTLKAPKAARAADCRTLEQLPNIGPALAADLRRLGIREPAELRLHDPFQLYPIFLSYPVPKAVSPRLGLGAQASIRWTMYRTRAIQRSGLVNCGAVT